MFSPDRESGLQRLEAFLPKAARAYASGRNTDYGQGNHETVSILSPWIRHRLICEEEVVRKVLRKHAFKSAEKFLQEVYWRSYFKGWLEQRPEVWSRYTNDLASQAKKLGVDPTLSQDYNAAVEGKTGIECFDCWTKELIQTGYLHNHARMWFASIWIFTLKLPWVLGADFFHRHLLDGDAASNTCSWRWVAGLHTKGKHYVARSSNIEKFTGGRFNPSGLLNESPLPLCEDWEARLVSPPQTNTIADAPYVLVLHDEDCSPETLDLPHPPAAIFAFDHPHRGSHFGTSPGVSEFSKSSVNDAMYRAEVHFGVDAKEFAAKGSIEDLIAFSKKTGLTSFVMPHLCVGPLKDMFSKYEPTLEEHDIRLTAIVRSYDLACWPYATRGFFKLKEKIPRIINELGLS